jgi:hypothetical protein
MVEIELYVKDISPGVMQAGKEYRVVDRSSLHYGKTVVISEVHHGIGVAQLGGGPYPFLPGHLKAVEPVPSKPKRATPAKRAAVYKALLERVVAEWKAMPPDLREELVAAMSL